ncbi:MAG TPA: nicotinamide-nucleotide adenylyltransferase [Nitrososphaeraceae archaeon]|nr:nicotinamide-nucleotide adenylyltransferase [Nitrososphaeraceae archaeon]
MSNRSKAAVLLGRFQPFHLGHLALVKQILIECKDLYLVIGSSQENYTPHNPFTTGERIRMIRHSLLDAKIDMNRILLIHVADDDNNARWLSNVMSYVPPFDFLYSGNLFITALLAHESIVLRNPKFILKDIYNGTKIRNMILENNLQWQNLVPTPVKEIIIEIKGVERIQKLNSSWTDSPFSYE